MSPTLRAPEVIEIVPYDTVRVRVGDVVLFLPPRTDQPVVHRVVRVTPEGISTLGDHNVREDAALLQRDDIHGQIVAAWRGRTRRRIAGGLRGRWTGWWIRWRRIPELRGGDLLRPLYRALARSGLIAGLWPAALRPRVVVFHAAGQDQRRLLLGRRVIGRYNGPRHQWHIQPPFRLCVAERVLCD